MNYGYIRVSTKEQNEARQLIEMEDVDIPLSNIYMDKQSGKDFERPEYKKLVKKLKAEDVLFIPSIDRLGRNYDEITRQWRLITKEICADIVVLDFPLLDTRAKMEGQDLTGRFIADLVLQILAYVAEKERDNLKARQAQGIAAARAKGVRLGRPPAPRPREAADYARLWHAGKISLDEIGIQMGVSRSTAYTLVKNIQPKK